ncbi:MULTISPECIES: sulfite exporter TauE/SafE family protein [unclassified Campylobacter]|uniref:sulfite exporter TauE/SafE family protein n=1 Tax=unclassified Campylobacter TaxID=2593542 RepID=UPI003D351B6A
MDLLFIILGLFVGFAGGFFGIGGGAVVVPSMLLFGYDMKFAVGVSIMQMLFSSAFGSYVNFKSKMLDVKPAVILGLGGFVGAMASGFVVEFFSSKFLLGMLIVLQILNLLKLLTTPSEPKGMPNESKFLLFLIGLIIGTTAISTGIGGSALIIPLLVGFLNYDIKKAASAGLFFVIFASVSGFVSLALHGFVNYTIGAMLGIGAVIGVYFGVKTAHKISRTAQKRWIIALLSIMLLIMINKFLNS